MEFLFFVFFTGTTGISLHRQLNYRPTQPVNPKSYKRSWEAIPYSLHYKPKCPASYIEGQSCHDIGNILSASGRNIPISSIHKIKPNSNTKAGMIVCNFDEFNSGWTQVLTRPNKLPPKLKLSKGFRRKDGKCNLSDYYTGDGLVQKLTSSDDQQLKIRFHITRGLGNNFNKTIETVTYTRFKMEKINNQFYTVIEETSDINFIQDYLLISNDIIDWPNLDVSDTDLVTRVDVLVSQTEEFESKWSKWSKWSECKFEEQTSFQTCFKGISGEACPDFEYCPDGYATFSSKSLTICTRQCGITTSSTTTTTTTSTTTTTTSPELMNTATSTADSSMETTMFFTTELPDYVEDYVEFEFINDEIEDVYTK